MILPSYLVLYENDRHVFVAYGQADLLTFASWKILLLTYFITYFSFFLPDIS